MVSSQPLTKPGILWSGLSTLQALSGKGQEGLWRTKDLHSEGGRPELEPQYHVTTPTHPQPPCLPNVGSNCIPRPRGEMVPHKWKHPYGP